MRKFIFTLIALMSMTFAMAQNKDKQGRPQPPKPMTADQMTSQMVSKLGLNSAQAAKVKALNKSYATLFQGPGMNGGQPPKMDKNGPSANDKGKRPAMTEAQKKKMDAEMKQLQVKENEYDAKLKTILTTAQFASYQKMKPQHGGPHGGKPGDNNKK
jgi:Spy/CpxP family protein refolding chaperone